MKQLQLLMTTRPYAPVKSPALWIQKEAAMYPLCYFKKPKWLPGDLWLEMLGEIKRSVRVDTSIMERIESLAKSRRTP